jgi:hypothetical protein
MDRPRDEVLPWARHATVPDEVLRLQAPYRGKEGKFIVPILGVKIL